MRLREAFGEEPPLVFVKVTKATLIPAGQEKEIHGLTKIKRGGYGVNLIGEVSQKHPLPHGLELKNSYSDLTPGSAKVNLMIMNTNKNIVIPTKAIVCQLHLANKIPKILLPTSKEENPEENIDESKSDSFTNLADLDYFDSGLTYEKVRAHQVNVEDPGEDLDEDFRGQPPHGKPEHDFVPTFTPRVKRMETPKRVGILLMMVHGY